MFTKLRLDPGYLFVWQGTQIHQGSLMCTGACGGQRTTSVSHQNLEEATERY